jgi:hypothetical protein
LGPKLPASIANAGGAVVSGLALAMPIASAVNLAGITFEARPAGAQVLVLRMHKQAQKPNQ